MTVYELKQYILDETQVQIFDFATGETEFTGEVNDIPDNYELREVSSIEHGKNEIIININTEE